MRSKDLTVRELIKYLLDCNLDAKVFVGNNSNNGISIGLCGGEGCTKENCDEISIDVYDYDTETA